MQTPDDHDLLIQLIERVKGIDDKLTAHLFDNGETVKDHETRIRRLEMWGAMAVGALAILQFILKFFIS